MRLLVLGGTRFVGRAVVADALERGWDVSALNRGVTGTLPDGVAALTADRTDPVALVAALDDSSWDLVVDTWSGAPRVATRAAAALVGRASRYAYVSSASVYVWGSHVDERSPLVEGDPDAGDGDYAALKRGAELGVLAAFPQALLVRAGLILGPYEDIGRLPWWLQRTARGGDVVAPGRPQRPLQYVDARDLAAWTLSALAAGLFGPYDVASRSGHTTTGELLQVCVEMTGADVRLVWISEDELAAAGAEPWTQLPIWVPERGDFEGFLEADTAKALSAGLTCRPIAETVADTWQWLRRDGAPVQREDRPVHGLPAGLEARLLAEHSPA